MGFRNEDDLNSEDRGTTTDAPVVQSRTRFTERSSSSWTVTRSVDFQVFVFTPDLSWAQRGDGKGRPLLLPLVQHSMCNLLL